MHIEYIAVKRFDSIWEKAVHDDPKVAEYNTELEFYQGWIKEYLDRLERDIDKSIALGFLKHAAKYQHLHIKIFKYYTTVFITNEREIDMKQLDDILRCLIQIIDEFEHFSVPKLNDYYINDNGELICFLED